VTATGLARYADRRVYFTGTAPLRSALQTVLIGGLAAAAAFGIARAIS